MNDEPHYMSLEEHMRQFDDESLSYLPPWQDPNRPPQPPGGPLCEEGHLRTLSRIASEDHDGELLVDLAAELRRELGVDSVVDRLLVDQLITSYAQTMLGNRVLFRLADKIHSGFHVLGSLLRFAQEMADGGNRRFLRTLQALQNLRRAPINVRIAQADQVNVAHQQINIHAPEEAPEEKEDEEERQASCVRQLT